MLAGEQEGKPPVKAPPPLPPQRSRASLGAKNCNSIHGHDLFGKSSQVPQVSSSPALLMFCSGINVGQALLMGPCALFRCKPIQSLEMAKGKILAQSFFFLKKTL